MRKTTFRRGGRQQAAAAAVCLLAGLLLQLAGPAQASSAAVSPAHDRPSFNPWRDRRVRFGRALQDLREESGPDCEAEDAPADLSGTDGDSEQQHAALQEPRFGSPPPVELPPHMHPRYRGLQSPRPSPQPSPRSSRRPSLAAGPRARPEVLFEQADSDVELERRIEEMEQVGPLLSPTEADPLFDLDVVVGAGVVGGAVDTVDAGGRHFITGRNGRRIGMALTPLQRHELHRLCVLLAMSVTGAAAASVAVLIALWIRSML